MVGENFPGEIFRTRFLTEPSLRLLVMHVSSFFFFLPPFSSSFFRTIALRSGNFIAGHFSSPDHRWGSWMLVMDACVPPKPAHLVRNPTRGWHRIDRSRGIAYTSRIALNDSFHAKTSGKSSTNHDEKNKKNIHKF